MFHNKNIQKSEVETAIRHGVGFEDMFGKKFGFVMLHPHSSTGHMSWNVDSTGTNLFLQYSSWMLLVELPTEWKSFLLSLKTPWSIPWRFRNPWNPKTTLKIHRGIMWNPWKLTICFPENAGIPPVETLGKSGRNFHRFSQVEPAIAALRNWRPLRGCVHDRLGICQHPASHCSADGGGYGKMWGHARTIYLCIIYYYKYNLRDLLMYD